MPCAGVLADTESVCDADPLSVPEAIPAMVAGSAEALIAVNGWLGQREDFLHPFQSLSRRQGTPLSSYCVMSL